MLLRHYIEQGMSKRAIARKLKISRDTLYRWIREGALDRDSDEQPVEYGPRPPVPTKLDPYKPLIQERLRAFPELSSVRLLEEIQAAATPAATRSSRSTCARCGRRRHPSR